jgi:hypothetical protein
VEILKVILKCWKEFLLLYLFARPDTISSYGLKYFNYYTLECFMKDYISSALWYEVLCMICTYYSYFLMYKFVRLNDQGLVTVHS